MRLWLLSYLSALVLGVGASAQEIPRQEPFQDARSSRQALPLLRPDAPRLALVIGQSGYQAGPLATAVNDAGLIAEALRGAGFDVTAGADLDETRLRDNLRDFIERVEQAPPETAVVVYLAGRALQYEGENIFLPIGARLAREGDALLHGIRLGDLAHALADTPPTVKVLLVDAGGSMPPFRNGRNPAPGLALMEPPENVVIGFSNAPDAIAPEAAPPYGAYAKALVEMMRLPGLGMEDMLAKTRLRVHEDTKGQQTPWNAGNLRLHDFNFFLPDANAALPQPPQPVAELRAKSLSDFPPAEAYAIVVERDRIADYQEFLRIYPQDPLAARVKILLAQRREALLWRKAITRNSPPSYWTYLRTYPQGSFVVEARRRLARLQAQPVPPEDFAPLMYDDIPPPLMGVEIVEPPYAIGGLIDLPPPPPPPIYILPPSNPEFVVLPPPPPRAAPYLLPVPVFVNRPQWARPPPLRPAPPPVRTNVQPPQTAPLIQSRPQSQPQPLAPNATPSAPRPSQPAVAPQAPQAQPLTRQELRQKLQQQQQSLQNQQGLPVTAQQRRELLQKLRNEQRRIRQAPNSPAPVQAAPQSPRIAPSISAPDPRRMEMQQKNQQLQQQREQNIQRQRQEQVLQQRQQQLEQRQQAIQNRIQQRQQQVQERQQHQMQQRQQHIQERQQAIQQKQVREQRQQRVKPNCGQPGQPPCSR